MTDSTLKRTLRHLRWRQTKVQKQITDIERLRNHISDDDLERYHLGKITDETELVPLEKHILGCPSVLRGTRRGSCDLVDTIRAALIAGGFDLEL